MDRNWRHMIPTLRDEWNQKRIKGAQLQVSLYSIWYIVAVHVCLFCEGVLPLIGNPCRLKEITSAQLTCKLTHMFSFTTGQWDAKQHFWRLTHQHSWNGMSWHGEDPCKKKQQHLAKSQYNNPKMVHFLKTEIAQCDIVDIRGPCTNRRILKDVFTCNFSMFRIYSTNHSINRICQDSWTE